MYSDIQHSNVYVTARHPNLRGTYWGIRHPDTRRRLLYCDTRHAKIGCIVTYGIPTCIMSYGIRTYEAPIARWGIRTYEASIDLYGHNTFEHTIYTQFKHLLWHKEFEHTMSGDILHSNSYCDIRHPNLQGTTYWCIVTHGIWTYNVWWHTAFKHPHTASELTRHLLRYCDTRHPHIRGIRTYEAFERTRHSNVRGIQTYETFERTRHSNLRSLATWGIQTCELTRTSMWHGTLNDTRTNHCDMTHLLACGFRERLLCDLVKKAQRTTFLDVHVRVYKYVRTCVSKFTCMCIYTFKYIHIYMCVCVCKYIHVLICIHTHTYMKENWIYLSSNCMNK